MGSVSAGVHCRRVFLLRQRGETTADGVYVFEAALGEGSFGRVDWYYSKQMFTDVAIKSSLQSLRGAAALAREVDLYYVLRQHRHPHVVEVYDSSNVRGQPRIVMQLSRYGSLSRYIRTQVRWS